MSSKYNIVDKIMTNMKKKKCKNYYFKYLGLHELDIQKFYLNKTLECLVHVD